MSEDAIVGADGVAGVWRRRRWLAVPVFVVPLAAVVGLAAFLPNVYRSAAVVLVERQQVPEAFVRSTVTSGLETRLQTISQEILSRARLEELIGRLDLYPDLRAAGASPDALVGRMRRDVQVELRGVDAVVRGGGIVAFTVSYVGREPATVAAVANTLASYYLEENTLARERQASSTAEFLRRQLDGVKGRLTRQEERLSGFKKQHVGETPESLESNIAVLERLTAQLRLNSDNQSRAGERRESLRRQLAGSEPGAPAAVAAAVDPRVTHLARLRDELAQLRTRFSDRYPDVIRLQAEIAGAERRLARSPAAEDEPAAGPAPPPSPAVLALRHELEEAEIEARRLKAEEQRLRDDFARYQLRVENTPLREREYQELSRDYDSTAELYRTLLKRYEEAQLAETLEQRQKGEQFRILEPAVPASLPAAPDRWRLLLIGALMAGGLAVGAALAAERLDPAVHTVEELRTLAPAPVLARIPPIVTRRDAWLARARRAAVVAVTVLAAAGVLGAAYLTARGDAPVVSPLAHALFLRS
jgi:polysaccharide chain length determinant protein (PEP-CTERM system associated)